MPAPKILQERHRCLGRILGQGEFWDRPGIPGDRPGIPGDLLGLARISDNSPNDLELFAVKPIKKNSRTWLDENLCYAFELIFLREVQ